MTYIASRSINGQAFVCGTGEDDSVQGLIQRRRRHRALWSQVRVNMLRTNECKIWRVIVGAPLYSYNCTATSLSFGVRKHAARARWSVRWKQRAEANVRSIEQASSGRVVQHSRPTVPALCRARCPMRGRKKTPRGGVFL